MIASDELDNKYLLSIEKASRGIVLNRRHKLRRFHSNIHSEMVQFIENCYQAMFPLVFDNEDCGTSDQLDFMRRSSFVSRIFLNLSNILFYLGIRKKKAIELAEGFLEKIPDIFSLLESDAQSCYEKDPACKSIDEAILCYPGFWAVMIYRVAHELYLMNIEYLPRLLCEYAHRYTGIDIHPGATIGKNFFIDHGTGVVIGETTTIGENVVIYQNVTLGAKRVERQENGQLIKGRKRHPDIGDNCVIYAGATILGGDTKIGKNTIIGGNVWLTHSVPDNSVIKNTDNH